LGKKISKEARESDDICEKCDFGKMLYKEGIKNGKHWQGWFCQNIACKNVVWGPKKYDDNKAQAEQDEADSVPEDPFDNLDR